MKETTFSIITLSIFSQPTSPRLPPPIAADGGDPSLLGESEAKEVSGTITEWKKRAMRYGLEIFFLNGVNKFFITSACAIH